MIIFNVPDGQPVKYDGGRRVYEIPSNGILWTQFKMNFGTYRANYYYVHAGDEQQEIPTLWLPHSSGKEVGVYVFGKISGTAGYEPPRGNMVSYGPEATPGSGAFTYVSYLVGEVKDVEWLSKQASIKEDTVKAILRRNYPVSREK